MKAPSQTSLCQRPQISPSLPSLPTKPKGRLCFCFISVVYSYRHPPETRSISLRNSLSVHILREQAGHLTDTSLFACCITHLSHCGIVLGDSDLHRQCPSNVLLPKQSILVARHAVIFKRKKTKNYSLLPTSE